MKQYKPDSYSKQARDLANRFFEWENKEDALFVLRRRAEYYDFKHDLITQRAIKSFMRKYKKYLKKKERR